MNITGKHLLGKRLLKECVHRSSPSNRSVQAPYAEPNRCIGATPQVKHPVQLNYINLMLRLNCFFQAKEGRYEEALDAALALVAASQKEEGCVSYDVFESGTRADVFMICETWASQEALDAHKQTAHFIQYVAQLEECGALKLEQFDFPAK